MKKTLLFSFLIFVVSFSLCGSESDEKGSKPKDEIKPYILDNYCKQNENKPRINE